MTVWYEGRPIGSVTVKERLPRKFFGELIPGPGFEPSRHLFDEAAQWSRQFDETPSNQPVNYLAWDRWIEVIHRITSHIALPELPVAILEFAVDHELKVEVTFEHFISK